MTNGAANLLSLKLVFARNSVDQPIYPRRGSEFSASVQFTPPYSLWDGKDYKKLAVQGTVVPGADEKLEPGADAQGRDGLPGQLQ